MTIDPGFKEFKADFTKEDFKKGFTDELKLQSQSSNLGQAVQNQDYIINNLWNIYSLSISANLSQSDIESRFKTFIKDKAFTLGLLGDQKQIQEIVNIAIKTLFPLLKQPQTPFLRVIINPLLRAAYHYYHQIPLHQIN